MRNKLIQLGMSTFKEVSRYHTFNVRLVRLETTKICNLKCPLCRRNYTSSISTEPGPKHLTVEALQKIIATTNMMVVRFEGDGEPLCNPYFKDLLRFCEKRGIHSAMGTNATLLDKDYVKFLEEHGIIRMHVSFDGAKKDTFEKARLGADYEKVLYNCILVGKSKIQLFMNVLMSSDGIVEELPEYVDLARSVGATGILLLKLQRETLDWSSPDWSKHEGAVKEFEKKVKENKLVYAGTVTEKPRFTRCYDPYISPFITLSGEVYACSYMGNLHKTEVYLDKVFPIPYVNYRMGNLNSSQMKAIWYSKDWKDLRAYLNRTDYKGLSLTPEELLELKLDTNGRFGFCIGCLCRWGESGI